MNWKRLREKILDEYYPDADELREVEEVYKEISEYIQEEFGNETHFAGSAGRRTCMKGDKDIDLFVLFPSETERGELEEKGLKIGKDVFNQFGGNYEIEYAEHPYTKGEINGLEVEIVPCYDVEPENIQSSVDRTPHHSRWVKENLSKKQKKDAVILKAFLTANNLYGSSLRVQGFSGYLCEILVHEFGDFKTLVEKAVEWQEDELIDPETHHVQLPEKLEKQFKDEKLRVIDPVDPERNVASVLSDENFAKFIHLCWNFTREPGFNFFQEKKVDLDRFALEQEIERRAPFLVLEFETVDEVDDIVYPQLRKAVRRLNSELEKHDFRIYESGLYVGDKTRIFFEIDPSLPEIELVKGPKVFHNKKHLNEFSSKYDNTFIEDSRLMAKTERKYTDARKFLKDFLTGDVEEKGIPSGISDEISDFNFCEPMVDDEKWLKYLTEKLHVE